MSIFILKTIAIAKTKANNMAQPYELALESQLHSALFIIYTAVGHIGRDMQ